MSHRPGGGWTIHHSPNRSGHPLPRWRHGDSQYRTWKMRWHRAIDHRRIRPCPLRHRRTAIRAAHPRIPVQQEQPHVPAPCLQSPLGRLNPSHQRSLQA
ncbi:MAG TPA: hypothetical protein DCP31_15010 [Cyanobacteria bacterium UBA8543]|nr:hypothetical protein [Cyanobacteria bacterium UBA8543]